MTKFGRPPKFDTADDLQKKVEEYFISGHNKKKVTTSTGAEIEVPYITITDLAIFLGFESRQSIYDYEKNGDFSYIIKRARLFVEREYEERLFGQSPTGAIFALKNMGWVDKQEIDNNIKGEIGVNDLKTLTTEELLRQKQENEQSSTDK